MTQLQRIPSWLLPLVLTAPACDKAEEAPQQKAAEDELPDTNIKVELPASPDFQEGKAPEKWEEGCVGGECPWSIWGLRQKLDENVKAGETGTEILVKGWVQEVYVAPPCPEGQMCPPPKQPHLWITDEVDSKGKKRAMMVVNYRFVIPEWDAKRWKDQPVVEFVEGKRYTFKGKFKQFSDTGFAFDRGLLEFVAYKPIDPTTNQEAADWVYPPGAPWHPLEIARQQEANAALVEKAKATAVPQPK
jgi:hypothetical protein